MHSMDEELPPIEPWPEGFRLKRKRLRRQSLTLAATFLKHPNIAVAHCCSMTHLPVASLYLSIAQPTRLIKTQQAQQKTLRYSNSRPNSSTRTSGAFLCPSTDPPRLARLSRSGPVRRTPWFPPARPGRRVGRRQRAAHQRAEAAEALAQLGAGGRRGQVLHLGRPGCGRGAAEAQSSVGRHQVRLQTRRGRSEEAPASALRRVFEALAGDHFASVT